MIKKKFFSTFIFFIQFFMRNFLCIINFTVRVYCLNFLDSLGKVILSYLVINYWAVEILNNTLMKKKGLPSFWNQGLFWTDSGQNLWNQLFISMNGNQDSVPELFEKLFSNFSQVNFQKYLYNLSKKGSLVEFSEKSQRS